MEYVYSALLLHSAGQKIGEDSITKVLKAAGVKADPARVKALTASLEDVDIEEAVSQAVAVPAAGAAPAAGAPAEAAAEAPVEEEEEEVSEEEAAAGLGALFG